MSLILLLALPYLLVYPSLCKGFPHDLIFTQLKNGGHLVRKANHPQVVGVSKIEKQNLLRKSSLHPSTINRPLEAKYYIAVSVVTTKSHFSVSPKFLSLSVSPRKVAGTACIPWDSSKLQAITRPLSPMWLRIGGTESDYVKFVPPISFPSSYSFSNNYFDDSEQGDIEENSLDYSGNSELDSGGSGYYNSYPPPPPLQTRKRRKGTSTLPNPNSTNDTAQETSRDFKIHCKVEEDEELDENSSSVAIEMLPYEWDRLHKFSKKVGWKVIFALNVQLRGYLDWDMTNALNLIKYNLQRGYDTAWELGNEPTRFPLLPNAKTISPEQLSYDFSTLRTVLGSLIRSPSFIAGPDISAPSSKDAISNKHRISHSEYLKRFLAESDHYGGVVDAVSWHSYYLDGRTATMNQFISYSVMDKLLKEVKQISSILGNSSLPMWLGETGETLHGGASGLSNSFLGGFLFMDKLGLSAALGVKVMMQHTLMGNNGLLQTDLTPLPNYWIAVLYKHLVGNKVLSVQNGLLSGRKGRVYAHCTRYHIKPPTRIPKYYYGDVTLLVVNTYHSALQLILLKEFEDKNKDIYFLTPLDYNIKSKSITLNRVKLLLYANGRLPSFTPITVGRNKAVTVPSLSYGFVVIKNAQAAACIKY